MPHAVSPSSCLSAAAQCPRTCGGRRAVAATPDILRALAIATRTTSSALSAAARFSSSSRRWKRYSCSVSGKVGCSSAKIATSSRMKPQPSCGFCSFMIGSPVARSNRLLVGWRNLLPLQSMLLAWAYGRSGCLESAGRRRDDSQAPGLSRSEQAYSQGSLIGSVPRSASISEMACSK